MVNTGYPVPAAERVGIPLRLIGVTEHLDFDGLFTHDFWQRGGPILWNHDPHTVIGRTVHLRHYVHAVRIEAVMRFSAVSPRAKTIQREIENGKVYGASLGLTSTIYNETIDVSARTILVREATLQEWSICKRGADPGARSVGKVILKVKTPPSPGWRSI